MIYKIKLLGDYNKELIESIKQEHKDKQEGIYEIYDNLYAVGIIGRGEGIGAIRGDIIHCLSCFVSPVEQEYTWRFTN